ncbi:two-partner secretion domain-containing protein [Methylobacterium sp. WSM2598]|uniref:two-partner secretion domain-containing protein n=1 Tax=Methylobacterium sp. WSM2598 TaxID=398261 RepID=UPI000371271E|nr:filamentous hemagglutinin N-terminal domain-containing protein [Methylobacterium sp. WSM2598]
MPVRSLAPRLLAALLATTALTRTAPAQTLPSGGQVVAGSVSIGAPRNGALTVTQASPNAIVNWQGFSIGQGGRVEFRQPDAQAAILNRVTGTTPSTIAGQLTANGQVYLVNPNGIAITPTGRVEAGAFVASSLGITDGDFLAGRRSFRGSGASAPVTQAGTLTIARGGYAALIGGEVANSGVITVPAGKVGLGSGEEATLDLAGDGFLQVAVPTRRAGAGALVAHSGVISAEGGTVTLRAAAAREMARQAVNLSGVVEARSFTTRGGTILLSGGDGQVEVGAAARLDASGGPQGGRVRIRGREVSVAGRIEASGARGGRVGIRAGESLALSGLLAAAGRSGAGGSVVATAPAMALSLARIDVSGAAGGGRVRLGGGRQGQGGLAHATTLSVDAGSEIRAEATARGAGGDVVLWSDGRTDFSGTIVATGGRLGGDGGAAEVSSKVVLAYRGRTDLTAPAGAAGTLLLDPYDLTISGAADSGLSGFAASANDSVLSVGTLQTALGSANVTVTTGTGGSQAGDITVADPVTWSGGTTLTLAAARHVAVNANLTGGTGAQIVLRADAAGSGTGTVTFGSGVQATASGGVALYYNPADYATRPITRRMPDRGRC